MKYCNCTATNNAVYLKKQGNHTGLYCQNCGKWIKWCGKNEVRKLRDIDRVPYLED